MTHDTYAVIMAGGRGTRFWPLSRRTRAKQFLQVTRGGTLIQNTVSRITPLVPTERILVVLGEDQRDECRRQLSDLPESNFIVEPVGRNTAPAIALSSAAVFERDPDAVMIVLPADHLISDVDEYRAALASAASVAGRAPVLVVMGIQPTGPETGFGYISPGDAWTVEGGREFRRVARFAEKPSREEAQAYIEQGYLWNSGMFVWRASTIQKEIETHLPDLHRAITDLARTPPGPQREEALRRTYPSLEAVSVDYGVMEKSSEVVVVPCRFGWNDVGTWSALADVWQKDSSGNAIRGTTVTLDSRGCIVSGGERLVALIDMQNVIVVDTPDAVLVCPVSSDQKIRNLVRLMDSPTFDRYL